MNKILNDKSLLSKLLSNSKNDQNLAFVEMYQRYFSLIEQYVLRNSGNTSDAKDVFQDGLIVFYQYLSKQDFSLESSIKTLIYAICKNLWLEKMRKGKKIILDEESMKNFQVDKTAQDVLIDSQEKLKIQSLLHQLGDPCKSLLTMYYFNRFSMAEIAERLDYASADVAKNKKSLCMKKLKALFKKQF